MMVPTRWHIAAGPAALLGTTSIVPTSAAAHASEQALVMLLPTDVWSVAGAAVVALTALLLYRLPDARLHRPQPATATPRLPAAAMGAAGIAAALLSFLGLAALLSIGWLGPRDPGRNLLPLTTWTAFWVGLPILCALVGNPWRVLNPWAGPMWLLRRLGLARAHLVPTGSRLGAMPAVLVLIALTAFALADPAPADPERLAVVLSIYWLIGFAVSWTLGERVWLDRFDGFNLWFERFATLAPHRSRRAGLPERGIASGVLQRDVPSPSIALGCLVLLAAGSFDGLYQTFLWLDLLNVNPLLYPGRTAMATSTVLGLLGLIAAVVGAFALACAVGVWLARRQPSGPTPGTGRLFRTLAPSVLPIALGYHVAHYLGTLLVDGQYLLASVSDPFGDGRDLFGTAMRPVTTGFYNTTGGVRTLWWVQAMAVVAGHVAAVVIAHVRAVRAFDIDDPARSAQARRAHAPLVLLMLAYTLFGLWLLAAPRGA